MALETPQYKVVSEYDDFEIRRYSEMIIATTSVRSDYKGATSSGFRRIANYIFGGNDKEMKIAMTAPVIADCPSDNRESYNISFVMPIEHSLKDLPKSNTENVSIQKESLGEVAVFSFGGWRQSLDAKAFKKNLQHFCSKTTLKQAEALWSPSLMLLM